MNVRPDIVELLRAGIGDRAIARRLGVGWRDVNQARRALGIAPCKPGRKQTATAEDLYWQRVRPVAGGHMEWTGARNTGDTPSLICNGTRLSAYRIAFRIKHGRDPEGLVKPSCGYDHCVAPGHLDDRVIRDRDNTTYDAIFGGAA